MHQLHDAESFHKILGRLQQALRRWETLGYSARNTRVGFYETVMQRLIDLGPEGILREFNPEEAARAYVVFSEIHEFLFVSETICDRPHLLAHPRLREIFSGQATAANEENPVPRNTLFELLVASVLERATMTTDVTKVADVETTIGDRFLCFECKRPQGLGGLKNCMRDATKQLRNRLPVLGETAVGIVALSFSKVVTKGTHRLEAADEGNMHAMMRRVSDVAVGHIMPFWSKYQSHSAVLVHVCVAGSIETPFVNSQYTLAARPNITPECLSTLQDLQEALTKITL